MGCQSYLLLDLPNPSQTRSTIGMVLGIYTAPRQPGQTICVVKCRIQTDSVQTCCSRIPAKQTKETRGKGAYVIMPHVQVNPGNSSFTVASGNANSFGVGSRIDVYDGDQLLLLGTVNITAVWEVSKFWPFRSISSTKLFLQHFSLGFRV